MVNAQETHYSHWPIACNLVANRAGSFAGRVACWRGVRLSNNSCNVSTLADTCPVYRKKDDEASARRSHPVPAVRGYFYHQLW